MPDAANGSDVLIPADGLHLEGMLVLPAGARGVVAFAHGSGSGRLSPRNTFVAGRLHQAGVGTLLFDLLTREEDRDYQRRFDIALLTRRLLAATRWLQSEALPQSRRVGYFGASTGAAAALQAAAVLGDGITAVVSRGGRPDLAGSEALTAVRCPTLLLVGGYDDVVIGLNQQAYALMTCAKELRIVPRATHLFEEPGTLEQVAQEAADWFVRHFSG